MPTRLYTIKARFTSEYPVRPQNPAPVTTAMSVVAQKPIDATGATEFRILPGSTVMRNVARHIATRGDSRKTGAAKKRGPARNRHTPVNHTMATICTIEFVTEVRFGAIKTPINHRGRRNTKEDLIVIISITLAVNEPAVCRTYGDDTLRPHLMCPATKPCDLRTQHR